MPPNNPPEVQRPVNPEILTLPPEPPKNRKGIVIAAIGTILVLCGLGVAAVVLLNQKTDQTTQQDTVQQESELNPPPSADSEWEQLAANGDERVYRYKGSTCVLSLLTPENLEGIDHISIRGVVNEGLTYVAENVAMTADNTVYTASEPLMIQKEGSGYSQLGTAQVVIDEKYKGKIHGRRNGGKYDLVILTLCTKEDFTKLYDDTILPYIEKFKVVNSN